MVGVGFLSRVDTGERGINHALGYVIVALVVPAAVALIAFSRSGAEQPHALSRASVVVRPPRGTPAEHHRLQAVA